jgi:OOP family OmpA-OmpF porin
VGERAGRNPAEAGAVLAERPNSEAVPEASQAEPRPLSQEHFASKEDWLLDVIRQTVAPVSTADTFFPEAPHSTDSEEAPTADATDESLEKLRRLILGAEIDGLAELRRQLADPRRQAEAVSRVVAEALRLKARRDDELVVALKATVDQIMRSTVRNNPADLADNLFPVMGPAIRRSIAESFRSMLQDFSRSLEKSFSFTGLKWRFEAARTGRKFSEVVLLKTLEYQVEQVFLIQVDSGLSLLHLYHDKALPTDDADQVSAMLTVMQRFVNDSFAEGELSAIEFGEFNIYIVRAPQVYLACVVRGQAPSDLRTDMRIALERIVADCAEELDAGSLSKDALARATLYAEALLSSRYRDEGGKLSWTIRLLPLAVILAILGGLGFWQYKGYETGRLEERVRAALGQAGVIPLTVEPSRFGPWRVTVLQDELAAPLDGPIAAAGLPRERLILSAQPFISQDVDIVGQRLRDLLRDAPPGIEQEPDPAALAERRATLNGAASIPWALSAYERLRAVPGVRDVEVRVQDPDRDVALAIKNRQVNLTGQTALVPWLFPVYERLKNLGGIDGLSLNLRDSGNGVAASLENGVLTFKGQASLSWQTAVAANVPAGSVDLSGLTDDADTRALKTLRDRINQRVILFPLGGDQPVPADQALLEQAVDDLIALEKLAASMDMLVSLIIYGHADVTGSDRRNYELSQARTKTVAAQLYARGSAIPISTYGLGSEFAAQDDQSSRKIELRVDLHRR